MRKEIVNQEIDLGERRVVIKKAWKVDKSKEYPDGIEYALQYLYNKDGLWLQVARIDNQLHESRPGSHIHIMKREEVIWEDLSLPEAKERIIDIGESVIRNIIDRI